MIDFHSSRLHFVNPAITPPTSASTEDPRLHGGPLHLHTALFLIMLHRGRSSLLLEGEYSLSLSRCSPWYCRVIFFLRLWPFSYSIFLPFLGIGLPAYFSNHCPFLRVHMFVSFNKFSSLVCRFTCHPSSQATRAYCFSKNEMGFYVCGVMCVQIWDFLF